MPVELDDTVADYFDDCLPLRLFRMILDASEMKMNFVPLASLPMSQTHGLLYYNYLSQFKIKLILWWQECWKSSYFCVRNTDGKI